MNRPKTIISSPHESGKHNPPFKESGDGRLTIDGRPVHPITPDDETFADAGLAADADGFDEAWFGHAPIVLSRYLTSDDDGGRAA